MQKAVKTKRLDGLCRQALLPKVSLVARMCFLSACNIM